MGNINLGKNNIEFRSVDQALQIIKNAMLDEKEIWIDGDNVYPSMAICLNGEYAAITYFQSEDGEMWLSYNENNQKVVTFLAGGEEWIKQHISNIRKKLEAADGIDHIEAVYGIGFRFK